MRLKNSRHWLMSLLVAGILLELGFLYSDTLLWMKTSWFGYTPDRAGIFVPPLFLWMAYTRLKQHPKTTAESPYAGFSVVAFSLLAYMLARVIDINFIQALSFIGVAFGMVIFFGGMRLGGRFLFPFVFLMLMIPSVSYLIESMAGAALRWAVIRGSFTLLHATGGAWQFHPAGLQYGEEFLQIGFSRGGVSSILFLLIVHFAACEWFLKREPRKFFFMVHFPLYYVAAHIFYYTFAGWAVALNRDRLNAVIVSGELWIQLIIYIVLVVTILSLAGRGGGKSGHLMRGRG